MNAMALPLLLVIDWPSPGLWRGVSAALLMLVSLGLLLPSGGPHGARRRGAALLSGFAGLTLLWWAIPRWGSMTSEAGFWVFASITLASAAATISSRSPVYSAIWFAISLLGTAGLLLLQGAQFLGIATVAVYAGAIVVTFLFVLMLAQPQGHAYYDRVSWGMTPRMLASLIAVSFALLIASSLTRPNQTVLADREAVLTELQAELATLVPGAQLRAVRYETRADQPSARLAIAVPADQREVFDAHVERFRQVGLSRIQARHADWQLAQLMIEPQDVRTADHTAHLGSQLFSRQLVAVQAAGAMLMAALVGAVAIAGRSSGLDNKSGRV